MAWKYSALQEKLSSIQTQLLIKMEQKSECSDELMPMNVTSNCVQDNCDVRPVSQKRKAEDHFFADNPKNVRPCLMLDMYTQTDRTTSSDISLKQIYDLVWKNSERLQKVEEMVTKLQSMMENTTSLAFKTHSLPNLPIKKPISSTPVLTQDHPPPVGTRPQFLGTSYTGISMSNSSFSSPDYVTQASEIGDWDGSQDRHDLTTAASAAAPTPGETRLVDVSATPVKNSTKEEWSCESGALAGISDQPSGPGCWLGDANDVNRRAWFSGDPKIIERCESYGVNPVKLALSLTEALFTREEMAASNVRGTRGKETLDPSKIKAIRAHVDYKYPIEEDRMEVRWQLIKPKLDSKCRSQRRLQREQKWKFERISEKQTSNTTTKPKRPVLDVEEREMLLYGSPKTVLNPVVSVYTENTTDTTSFSEGQEGFLQNPGE